MIGDYLLAALVGALSGALVTLPLSLYLHRRAR